MGGIKLVPGLGFPSSGGGSSSPGGVNQDIQFNDNGSFGGEHTDGISTPGMTWDKVLGQFTVIGASPGGSCAMQASPLGGAGFQVSDSIVKMGSEGPNCPVSIETGDPTSVISIESAGAVDIEADGGNATLQSDTGTAQVVGADALLHANVGNALIDGAGSVALQNNGIISLVSQESTGTPKLGFLGANPTAQITINGSRGGNVALAQLITALATFGLIVDNTTP
jgi:hypothetical protein